MKIKFIGHCTFLITFEDGRTLMTDPWFRNGGVLRSTPTPFKPDDFEKIDFMLSSHNHLDHLDVPSLVMAREQNVKFAGSICAATRARRAGIKESFPLRAGNTLQYDGLKITSAPARHPFAPHAVGFLIEAEGRIIYFSGDTINFTELQDFLSPHKINIAFFQVMCARYFGREDGMTDETAFQLAQIIKPDIGIPMHCHARGKHGNAERFCNRMRNEKMQAHNFSIGEEMKF